MLYIGVGFNVNIIINKFGPLLLSSIIISYLFKIIPTHKIYLYIYGVVYLIDYGQLSFFSNHTKIS